MLPFLKPKHQVGVIVSARKPDENKEYDESKDSDSALHACASDLIKCVMARDEKGVASAMRAAFEILESQPHEESGEPSFQDQNIKAAEKGE